jgi:hypothetical protein
MSEVTILSSGGSMRFYLVLASTVIGFVLTASSLPAQQTSRPSLFQFAPYAGYMIFGDYLKGPVGTSLSNANGAVYGAQLGVNVSKYAALVANVGRASADLQVGLPFIGGISIGNSSLWLYDASIQLGAPLGDRSSIPLTPFVQFGIGELRHSIDAVIKTTATNTAFNAGIGADIGLTRNIGVRVMAKDYFGKFDFKEAVGLELDREVAHNWAISGGLKVEF